MVDSGGRGDRLARQVNQTSTIAAQSGVASRSPATADRHSRCEQRAGLRIISTSMSMPREASAFRMLPHRGKVSVLIGTERRQVRSGDVQPLRSPREAALIRHGQER